MSGALGERLALVVVSDADCGPDRELVEVVRAAVAGGAPAVQLRAKSESIREAYELAVRLREVTAARGALLFVNDRVDVALASGADGAHLGDDDLPLAAARRIVPADFLLGRSVETPEDARRAAAEGADYLGVGAVFLTPSKLDTGPAIGLEGVRRAAQSAGAIPIVAIGGIDESNAAEVARAGAHGVAVIRAVMRAPDPAAAAARLLAAVRGERVRG
jgi:thiamine-phosphate pyrophosphorylase